MRFSCAVPCGPKMVPFHVRMYCAPAGAAPQPKRPGRPTEASPETACDSRLPRAAPRIPGAARPRGGGRRQRDGPAAAPCRPQLRAAAPCRPQLRSEATQRAGVVRTRSSASSRPYDTEPSPMPFSPFSSSSSSLLWVCARAASVRCPATALGFTYKLRGTTVPLMALAGSARGQTAGPWKAGGRGEDLAWHRPSRRHGPRSHAFPRGTALKDGTRRHDACCEFVRWALRPVQRQ